MHACLQHQQASAERAHPEQIRSDTLLLSSESAEDKKKISPVLLWGPKSLSVCPFWVLIMLTGSSANQSIRMTSVTP